MGKRRKRSEMTEEECFTAVRDFAKRIDRMLDSSEGINGPYEPAPENHITAKILVHGGFGANAKFWEAMRVLGNHKLPARKK